jgi:sugar phosphate permease
LRATALVAFALGALAYVFLGIESGIAAFVATIVLWSFSGSLLRPILDARIAELAPEGARGTLLGFGDSLDNFSLMFAPVSAAAIVGLSPRFVGVLPALSLLAGGVLTWRDR